MEGTRNALDPTRNAQSYAQDSTPEVCGTDWSCRNVQHACYQRRSERQQFWGNREYLPDRASGRDAEKCKEQAPRADRKSTRRTPVTNAHHVCRLLLEKKNTKNKSKQN